MPEGDTILRARNRLADALLGQQLSVSAPSARGRACGVQQLDGRTLDEVKTHGKHLMLIFGELALHSHLGMKGSWQLYPKGARWRGPRSAAWALLAGERQEAVQFRGSTLRVLRTAQLALDPALAHLGPDILAPEFEVAKVLSALREVDQGRGLGDALLDQRLVAGIGNIYKSEGCFKARVDPWSPLAALSDTQIAAVLLAARRQMQISVATGRESFSIYRRRGPCVRCGGRVLSRGQGDANRTTWWCAGCQPRL